MMEPSSELSFWPKKPLLKIWVQNSNLYVVRRSFPFFSVNARNIYTLKALFSQNMTKKECFYSDSIFLTFWLKLLISRRYCATALLSKSCTPCIWPEIEAIENREKRALISRSSKVNVYRVHCCHERPHWVPQNELPLVSPVLPLPNACIASLLQSQSRGWQ